MNQLFISFFIWLVSHRQIQPVFLIYDTLNVRKSIKSVFSVIRTHTAFAKTAESHFAGSQMNNRIIDTAAAKPTPGSYFSGNNLT